MFSFYCGDRRAWHKTPNLNFPCLKVTKLHAAYLAAAVTAPRGGMLRDRYEELRALCLARLPLRSFCDERCKTLRKSTFSISEHHATVPCQVLSPMKSSVRSPFHVIPHFRDMRAHRVLAQDNKMNVYQLYIAIGELTG